MIKSFDAYAWPVRVLAGLGLGGLVGAGHLVDAPLLVSLLALSALGACYFTTTSARRAALLGWAAGTGYFGVALHWITEPFQVDAANFGWMAPFALALMAAGLALFWALAFGVAYHIHARRGLRGALALAAAFTLSELLRAYALTGFPWALLAYIWVDTPVAQTAALLGPYALGMLTLLGAIGFAPVFIAQRRLLPLLAILPVMWVGGDLRLPDRAAPSRADGYMVRLVQPNAPQALKWRQDKIPEFVGRGLMANYTEGQRDISIWPETSFPLFLNEDARSINGYDIAWSMLSETGNGRPVIVGGVTPKPTAERMQFANLLAVVTGTEGDRTTVYEKHHLVPFGEYLPFSALFDRLKLQALAQNLPNGFAPGQGPTVLTPEGVPAFIPLICYEVIFPHEVRAAGNGAEWIVQITNDAWFGDGAGPRQHLAQAQFRAIETGLPVARSANTGISAMIDPWGRITKSVPMNSFGLIDAALPHAISRPQYSKSGDLPLILALLTVLGALFFTRNRRQNH